MTINSPKISVILPTYNTNPEWFKEAVESILNQTFFDFELIIINDGSKQNEDEIIKSYSDSRIRYVKQENMGIAKTLNRCIELAKGEYIARMDADDISLPTRFEKQVAYLDQYPEIGVLGTWFEMFPNKYIVEFPVNVKYLDLLKGCCIGHPTVMFRKELFQKNNLKYNPDYKCEDYELWSRAVRITKFANLPEILLKYRVHGNNLSKPTASFLSSGYHIQQNMLDFLTDDCDLQSRIKIALEEKQGVQIRFFIPRFIGNIMGMFMSHKKRKIFKAKYLRTKKVKD